MYIYIYTNYYQLLVSSRQQMGLPLGNIGSGLSRFCYLTHLGNLGNVVLEYAHTQTEVECSQVKKPFSFIMKRSPFTYLLYTHIYI